MVVRHAATKGHQHDVPPCALEKVVPQINGTLETSALGTNVCQGRTRYPHTRADIDHVTNFKGTRRKHSKTVN
eukprot:CAMPEP_0194518840 /NCGR_PEP_ID=MMETSP0253-20130528/52337_1 /TAXON_ID=2966 /ORGANISM="Noctiluca scintillans" /LENGTH=72 /DNA_ID=CAMNT_0039362915 /DNA_START=166 /DNA_END=384 /DNA_ORIENTATION=+